MIWRGVVSVDRLRELLNYDKDSGEFVWRVTTSNRVKRGAVAGYVAADGYVSIRIDGVLYKAHRLAFAISYGSWPSADIDHINGITSDNRLENLREATRAQNIQNTKMRSDNSSGFTGVTWDSARKKWAARIFKGGKGIYLGRHETPEDAYGAYLRAKAKVHELQPIPRGR